MYSKSTIARILKKCNFIVIIVPADALAPSGARASADTVMTMFVSHVYTGPALEGQTSITCPVRR